MAFVAENLLTLEYSLLDEPRFVMQLIHKHITTHGSVLVEMLADRPSPGAPTRLANLEGKGPHPLRRSVRPALCTQTL